MIQEDEEDVIENPWCRSKMIQEDVEKEYVKEVDEKKEQ